MKSTNLKITATLGLALLFSTMISAQNAPAFGKGDNTIGVSIGLGVSYAHYSNATNFPAITVYYDHGTFGEVGPGTIGIGGIIGFKTSHYNYPAYYGDYDATWTNYIIAARGTYHLTILKDKNNKFDPYGGVVLGVRINDYSDSYNDYYNKTYKKDYYTPYHGVDPVAGVFVGAKYNFTSYFGAFAEAGFDISFLRIGLNFNF